MSLKVTLPGGKAAIVTNIMADGSECDDLSKYPFPLDETTYYAHNILYKRALQKAGLPVEDLKLDR